jgi:hypothetical protein
MANVGFTPPTMGKSLKRSSLVDAQFAKFVPFGARLVRAALPKAP